MFKTPATLIAAAMAATGAFALPAAATPAKVTVAVPHGDLDLATPDGQDILQRRLDTAAKQVCSPPMNRSVTNARNQARCYRQTQRNVAVQFADVMAEQQVARGG